MAGSVPVRLKVPPEIERSPLSVAVTPAAGPVVAAVRLSVPPEMLVVPLTVIEDAELPVATVPFRSCNVPVPLTVRLPPTVSVPDALPVAVSPWTIRKVPAVTFRLPATATVTSPVFEPLPPMAK